METTLHRQLKEIYGGDDARYEVRLGRYRIDAVVGDKLIEIQHGSLAAIRDKIRKLLDRHRVLVVKPLVARKTLVKLDAKQGQVVERRLSPKRGGLLDVFDELVYFTRVFPHRNLTLETPLVEIEEWRYPGHGRRRRRRTNDFQVEDQKLVEVIQTRRFRTAADLLAALPVAKLPAPFHTAHLAAALGIQRWVAQRIVYCLRKMSAVRQVGKSGNAWLYEVGAPTRAKKAA